ncbi:MAG: FHA domain-containing protein [Thermoguttaceae bacterium]|jgi:pSer/pThr/pTyr-binding forkhead associated (FHA) protein|nr:FHA domain-containing protein [Thermoguttaceae bacterium]
MEARLTIVGGKANKKRVTLKLPIIIGRSRDADLTIAHPMVSRQHCELFEVQGLVRVRDLGSLNGTFIGDKQITEAALRPNDEFTIGPLTFRVDYEYAGEVTVVAPSVPEDRRPETPPPVTTTAANEPLDEPPSAAEPVEPPPWFGEVNGAESSSSSAEEAPGEFFAFISPAGPEEPVPPPVSAPSGFAGWTPEAATTLAGQAEPGLGSPPDAPLPGSVAPAEEALTSTTAGAPAPEFDQAASAGGTVEPAPAKKSRGWWPFGRKRKAAPPPRDVPAASPSANGQGESEPGPASETEGEAAADGRETLRDPGPDADTPMSGAPPVAHRPAQPAGEDGLDPELDAFLRGFE